MDDEDQPFDVFATLSFKGERFNGDYLPVDVLPSIAAYRQTLVEIAKEVWKEQNPEKDRLPKNFEKALQLGFGKVKHGSKVAYLPRIESDPQQSLPALDFGDVFIDSQELFARVVLAANSNSTLKPLPPSSLKPLEAMRKNLFANEVVLVDPISEGKRRPPKFSLTEKTVERLVEFSRVRKDQVIADLGIVKGVLESPAQVKLATAHGDISYRIDWSALRSEDSLGLGAVVSFSVFAEVDGIQQIKKVHEARALSKALTIGRAKYLLDEIAEFEDLEKGWYNGSGEEINDAAIIKAKDLAIFLGRKLNEVSVFPSVDGEVTFEWSEGRFAVSLTLDEEIILGVSDLGGEAFAEREYKGITSGLLRDIVSYKEILEG